MHQRNLIIRRFGALDFGLGYFDDGVWVDHATANGTIADELSLAPIDVVHDWLSCCDEQEDQPSAIESIVVLPERGLRIAAR